ncbi:MAG TPA: c-type cytochrome [Puia sp.]
MKIRLHLFLLLIGSSFFLVLSCSKTSEDKLNNNGGTCDTTNMQYTADVVPILQANCYSCHGAGNTDGSGGISLDSYADLKKYADNGFLKGNITHAPGYVGMPYGRPKLDDCDINKIIDWINRGTQND